MGKPLPPQPRLICPCCGQNIGGQVNVNDLAAFLRAYNKRLVLMRGRKRAGDQRRVMTLLRREVFNSLPEGVTMSQNLGLDGSNGIKKLARSIVERTMGLYGIELDTEDINNAVLMVERAIMDFFTTAPPATARPPQPAPRPKP